MFYCFERIFLIQLLSDSNGVGGVHHIDPIELQIMKNTDFFPTLRRRSQEHSKTVETTQNKNNTIPVDIPKDTCIKILQIGEMEISTCRELDDRFCSTLSALNHRLGRSEEKIRTSEIEVSR